MVLTKFYLICQATFFVYLVDVFPTVRFFLFIGSEAAILNVQTASSMMNFSEIAKDSATVTFQKLNSNCMIDKKS